MSCWLDVLTTLYIILHMISDNAKPMSIRMRSRCQYYSAEPMSNLTTLNIILHMISDNAKPMSIRMRSRCQYYSAKPMSKRIRRPCQDECEADVNIMRSLCQGECEADVKTGIPTATSSCWHSFLRGSATQPFGLAGRVAWVHCRTNPSTHVLLRKPPSGLLSR